MTDKLNKLMRVAEELEPICREAEELLERLDQLVLDIDDPDWRANAETAGGSLYDAVTKLWYLLGEVNGAITEAEEARNG